MYLEKEADAAQALSPWADRHLDALRSRLETHPQTLRTGFDAIDARRYRPSFDEALDRVRRFLGQR